MFKVLVVEDDIKLNRLYCIFLEKEGFEPVGVFDATQALAELGSQGIDLVLCDVMMPGIDGCTLVDIIRKSDSQIPILMATAKSSFADKQRAFSAGSDDYMVKPIDLNELKLRVAALLRRANKTSSRSMTIGNALLDLDTLTVTEGNRCEQLPQKEFLLLFKLLASPGRIFTRRDIMNDIWGRETDSDERTVDVHISRLRERFESSPSFEIITVRGLGYKAVVLS